MSDEEPLVCMLLHNCYDEDARVKREARALASRYRVRVIHLCGEGQPPGLDRDGLVEVDRLDVATRSLPGRPLFWAIKYLEFIIRIAWRAAHLRPDAYHAHDLPMVLPALLAARIHHAPVVYDAHELYAEMGMHSPRIAKVWAAIDRWVLRRVDRVIAVNESRAEVMIQELGSPRPFLVPNLPAHRPQSELPPKESSPLRRFVEERCDERHPLLLYQGVMARGRVLEQVVEAVARASTEPVLVLIGPRTEYLDQLLELARSRGVAERVLYHPAVDSDVLVNYTVGADAGLVIYAKVPRNNYLCAPNKLFEYCMANVPVIGCDFPEVRRVLGEYPVGEVFDVDSPDSIAAAIDRLLGDPVRLSRAQAAVRQVRERYHWGVARLELERLYSGLLGSAGGAPDITLSSTASRSAG